MEVLQPQTNGSNNNRKPYRPPRSSSTSPSGTLDEEEKPTKGSSRPIPLPFANSKTNHYVGESDESDDGDGVSMMIHTDGKEDGENDKSDGSEMAIDESLKENDSEGEGEEDGTTLKLQEEPKSNCGAEPEPNTTTNIVETMETETPGEISPESPKDPMSPEIQVMSSGQVCGKTNSRAGTCHVYLCFS